MGERIVCDHSAQFWSKSVTAEMFCHGCKSDLKRDPGDGTWYRVETPSQPSLKAHVTSDAHDRVGEPPSAPPRVLRGAMPRRFQTEEPNVSAEPSNEPKSILQDWVVRLGIRHQGVLISAVRGCDSADKNHPSKPLVMFFRAEILNPHCGNNGKPSSFLRQPEDYEDFVKGVDGFIASWDNMPLHFVLHFVHAAAIIGYHHPTEGIAATWRTAYMKICHKMHLEPEGRERMDARLNADESTFARNQ